jgi:ankyrin repeat protein
MSSKHIVYIFLLFCVLRDRTVLYLAAKHGHEQVVRTLLEAGADVEAALPSGARPYIAAQNGHVEVVRTLLEAGAQVEAPGACWWI